MHLRPSRLFLAVAAMVLTLVPSLSLGEVFENYEYSVNGESVTITRYNSSSGGEVVIPDMIDGKPVTTIGDSAFYGKFRISKITIPSTVTKIGAGAFNLCRNLRTVNIPSSVTSIGDQAFATCDQLVEVSLPGSVTDIGEFVFYNCYKLTSVTFEDGFERVGERMFYSCEYLTKVTFASSVVSIGEEAFNRCVRLTEIKLPSGLTDINDRAFSYCWNLLAIDIPDRVIRIGNGAFLGCWRLASVTISDSVEVIGDEAFSGSGYLTSVSFGKGLKKIGARAFFRAPVSSIDLPNSLSELGVSAFESCTKLKKATLSTSLVEIPERLFFGCASLKKITVPDSVKRIGASAFEGTGLKSVKLGKSLRNIGERAFHSCAKLARLTFPARLRSIGDSAFAGCVNLTTAIFTGKAPDLGRKAFKNNSSEFGVYLDKGAKGFTVPRWQGLTTRGATPEIGVRPSDKGFVEDGEGKVKFPDAIAVKGSSVVRIEIENLGNLKLKKLSARISGANPWDYSVKNLTKSSLAPGKTAVLVLEFVPREKGKSRATVEITSNDSNEGLFKVALSGRGLALVR